MSPPGSEAGSSSPATQNEDLAQLKNEMQELREAAARMSAAGGPLLLFVRREVQGQSTPKDMEKVSSAEQQQRICSPLQLFREGQTRHSRSGPSGEISRYTRPGSLGEVSGYTRPGLLAPASGRYRLLVGKHRCVWIGSPWFSCRCRYNVIFWRER